MKSLRTCTAVVALATALGASAQNQGSLLTGTPIPVTADLRTIVIRPDTKHINVDEGEAIKFVAGDAVFAWRFDGRYAKVFDLQQVAPGGALANPVKVYVRPKLLHDR
jgi:Heavy-metal resistance protein CzcE